MQLTWEFSVIDAAVLVAFIAILLVFLVAKYFYFRSRTNEIDRKFIASRWKEIETLINKKDEMSHRLAIIEADKLFDNVLKKLYFPGDKMSVRLKMASYKYPELKIVWVAHRVRNNIVHDVNYSISAREAVKNIGLYKKALKILKVL